MSFELNAINVISSKVEFPIGLRNPDEEDVEVTIYSLARFEPVIFDTDIVETIEAAARQRGLSSKRMASGAGYDAQMVERIIQSAIILNRVLMASVIILMNLHLKQI